MEEEWRNYRHSLLLILAVKVTYKDYNSSDFFLRMKQMMYENQILILIYWKDWRHDYNSSLYSISNERVYNKKREETSK